jgi:hypothetical protein
MFVLIVELLYRTWKRRERKRKCYCFNNVIKRNICEGRGHKDMYSKLLKNGGVGGKEARESNRKG